jgi:hypothetical protein
MRSLLAHGAGLVLIMLALRHKCQCEQHTYVTPDNPQQLFWLAGVGFGFVMALCFGA